jgi:hypothetical protein
MIFVTQNNNLPAHVIPTFEFRATLNNMSVSQWTVEITCGGCVRAVTAVLNKTEGLLMSHY